MVQIQQYPTTSGYRKLSVFPSPTQSLLRALATGLYERPSLVDELASLRSALKNLSPYAYRSAASDIRDLANLHHYRGGLRSLPRWNIVARILRQRRAATRRVNFERKLISEKDLPFLLLFDGNGYNREWALSKITGPLKSPIEVIALADLANNWVEPVRKIAIASIERCYPQTDPMVLAASFSFFAENQKFWKRWDKKASQRVMLCFHKPEVIGALANRLEEGIEPRGSRTLSYALQTENFDPYLERLVKNSKEASLRARALRALLDGEAVWTTGYTWKWIDKPLGKRKRVAVLDTRTLTMQLPKKPLLLTALNDKSAKIRKIAAQGVIEYGKELNLPIADIAHQLELDVSLGVRRRGEYLVRKLRAN